jgi:hypothetical protein
MAMTWSMPVLAAFSDRARRRPAAAPGRLRPYAATAAFDYRPRNQYIRGDKAAPGAADGKGWARD